MECRVVCKSRHPDDVPSRAQPERVAIYAAKRSDIDHACRGCPEESMSRNVTTDRRIPYNLTGIVNSGGNHVRPPTQSSQIRYDNHWFRGDVTPRPNGKHGHPRECHLCPSTATPE